MYENVTVSLVRAALVRAVRTAAQAAVAIAGSAVVIADVDWETLVSASLMAGVLSLLMSAAGLPEVDEGDRYTVPPED